MLKAIYDVPAPAKLNLFLHITGRRADGYHLLQSVFMLVDWCDRLHFETRADGLISREDLTLALPPDDLTVRAARALQRHTSCALGAHISVEKNIPAQAGMGGGSSDAATCLLALNRLWRLHLPLQTLEQIGLALGADVPFFLRGHNAWVAGIGEQITPLFGDAKLPTARFAIIKPAMGLETAKIFSAPHLPRATETATIIGFAAGPKFNFGRNDLQSVAQELCPDVTLALDLLRQQGLQGRMTGSGSAVFALCDQDSTDAQWAQRLQDSLPGPALGWQSKVCSNLEAHPLLGWASNDSLS
jgi:4-diphosphocytidyl-2-C-methyl-D-erythritol kinase